ncbi:MAG: hypothetical protein FJZ59_07440 [Chlamydiae bacterium]|nr:hypothetical protein [Chlamydiota bacterium]
MSLFRLIFVFITFIGFVFADDVRIGQLENGLTYYIQHNQFPKEKASLQLVVKVGSIYETEEERGIAHFLEHMLFRGSENFSDWEIVSYLESIGAKFGADTNAYTTFEHTTYLLQVPLEKKENLDKAILILSDFAGRAKLDKELIEKERTVVLDECNRGETQSAYRMQNKIYNEFFKNSSYEDRMPIGLKDVILHADPLLIQNFYKKWYRPNRMAMIVVGDIDVNQVEEKIKECFRSFTRGDETIKSIDVDFPKEPKSLFMVDEEEIFVQGAFTKFSQTKEEIEDVQASIKESLISSFSLSILNLRFDALTKDVSSPFLWAGIYKVPFTTYHEALKIHYIGYMDRPVDGIRALYKEIESLKEYGPTENELEREVLRTEEALKIGRENLHRIENDVYANSYHSHFLCNTLIGSFESGYKLQQDLVKLITCEDIKAWIKTNIQIDEMNRIFSMPTSEVISEEGVAGILKEVKNEGVEAPKVESNEDLQTEIGEVVNISETVSNEEMGTETIILDNGMKVILHPTSLEKGYVSIELVAEGGKTLFSKEEYLSSDLAAYYLLESGLANLNGAQLRNFLIKKDSLFYAQILANMRLINAKGPTSEAEVLFQAIRALFLEKRFDLNIWTNLMNQIKEIETYKNNMPELFFMEEYNRLLYEDHPFFVSGKITEANEEIAKRCAEVAFRDPLEFSVVIVGDFDVEVMKHLVSTYFSFKKIPTDDLRSIELPILPDVKDSVEHVVYKGKETHSTAIMSYRKLCKEKPISDLELSALTYILSERAMKKMRRELGDTYAVYFSYEFPLEPVRESLFVHLRFSCLPEKVQALQTEAEEVILEFLKSGPTEEEVSSAQKIIEQKVKEALLFDDFWKKLQRDEILYKIPASDILRNKKELSLITKENLLALSKEIFENTPVVKISLFPEVK